MTISGISTNVQALLSNKLTLKNVIAGAPEEDHKFEGYPSAAHWYVNTNSDYATVSQNRRVIEYKIEIYLVTNESATLEATFQQAYTMLDAAVQMLESSVDLSDTDLGLSRACDILRPVPGELERLSTPDGPGFGMSITLFCEADVTF